MLPPLPLAMLAYANTFSKLPKCTNIDLGGKGCAGILPYVSLALSNMKHPIQRVFKFGHD